MRNLNLMSSFYYVDSDYRGGPRFPVVVFLCRDIHGNKIILEYTKARPYFYVPCRVDYRHRIMDYHNRWCKKIYCQEPSQVTGMRGKFRWTNEADIPFVRRVEVDLGVIGSIGIDRKAGETVIGPGELIETPEAQPVRGYIDYELLKTSKERIDTQTTPFPICQANMMTNKSREVTIYISCKKKMLPPPFMMKIEGTLEGEKIDYGSFLINPVYCKDEKTLLSHDTQWIQDNDPDRILAHNGRNFDYPYRFNRAKMLGLSMDGWAVQTKKFKRGRMKYPSSDYQNFTCEGREFVEFGGMWKDKSGLYTRFLFESQQPSPTSMKLKHLSKKELGVVYEDEGIGARMKECYETVEGTKMAIEYGAMDVIVMYLIDEKLGLSKHFEGYRQYMYGGTLNDTMQRTVTNDVLALRVARRRNTPLPTKVSLDTEIDPKRKHVYNIKKTGGLVLPPPPPGVIYNVIIIDWSALYPNIMVARNMGTDTKQIIDGKVTFLDTPLGFFAEMVNEPMKRRELLRGVPGREQEEKCVKVAANAVSGVIGDYKWRLADYHVYNAITGTAREMLEEVIKELLKLQKIDPNFAEMFIEAIYGDTDSLFLKVKNFSEETLKIVMDAVYKINEAVCKRFGLKYSIDVKLERKCDSIVILGKKHYIAACQGELYYKGMELATLNQAPLVYKLMNEFYEKLMIEDDEDGAIKVLRDAWKRMPEMDDYDIAIPGGVNKDLKTGYKTKTAQVKGVIYAKEEFGWEFDPIDKPRRVYFKPITPVQDRRYAYTVGGTTAVCLLGDRREFPKAFRREMQPDYDVMRDKLIKSKFETIVKAIGRQWTEISTGMKTESLDDFFGRPVENKRTLKLVMTKAEIENFKNDKDKTV